MLVVGQFANIGGLPQILTLQFKSAAPIHAGKRGEVTVSFTALKDYAIDRMLPISLKPTPVPGVTLSKTEFTASIGPLTLIEPSSIGHFSSITWSLVIGRLRK